MSKKADIKRELILTKSKEVFIRKGFNRATMKDIVEECGISRGGIYLYFRATEEIFVEVVKRHNSAKLQAIKDSIEQSDDFAKLNDEFFAKEKERLLNMDKSLFAAMLEFCFGHKTAVYRDFYMEQFYSIKKMLLELLRFGREQNAVKSENIDRLADSVMFIIEGLRSLAVSAGITEELAEEQISVCKRMVLSDSL